MKKIILSSIHPNVLFEKYTRGAFGMSTEPANMKSMDKRLLGRYDPLSGDKFVKSKVGQFFHKDIPFTPKLNMMKGITPSKEGSKCEGCEENLDEAIVTLVEDLENVEELIAATPWRRVVTKAKRAIQNKPGHTGIDIEYAKAGDLQSQKKLIKAHPKLRKYSVMKTDKAGKKLPGLSDKGQKVLKSWERQRYVKDPVSKVLDPFTNPAESWKMSQQNS